MIFFINSNLPNGLRLTGPPFLWRVRVEPRVIRKLMILKILETAIERSMNSIHREIINPV
jgi:hypothetical protein